MSEKVYAVIWPVLEITSLKFALSKDLLYNNTINKIWLKSYIPWVMLFEDSADAAALSSQALRQHKGSHKRPLPDQGQVGK